MREPCQFSHCEARKYNDGARKAVPSQICDPDQDDVDCIVRAVSRCCAGTMATSLLTEIFGDSAAA